MLAEAWLAATERFSGDGGPSSRAKRPACLPGFA